MAAISLDSKDQIIDQIIEHFEESNWDSVIGKALVSKKYECYVTVKGMYNNYVDPYMYGACRERINDIVHKRYPDVFMISIISTDHRDLRIQFSWRHLKPDSTCSCLLL